MHRKLSIAKALALAFIISVQACEKKVAETGPQAPPEVLVTQVISGDVPVIREWVRTLDGSENADIRARVTGYLQKRDYQEGSYVKEGDLLFEIDPRPFEATLAQAKSELDQVQATQAAMRADFERSQELYNKKVISVQECENKRQLNQAQIAKTEALQAAAQTAQLNLDYTKISAPVDGIAGLSKANIGDLVGTGSEVTLTTVSKIDPIRLYFPINEQDYKKHAIALQKGCKDRNLSVRLRSNWCSRTGPFIPSKKSSLSSTGRWIPRPARSCSGKFS
jgi:membrane fusion protein, multidrug efflux system